MDVNAIPKSYRYLIDDKMFLDDDGSNLAPKIFYDRFELAFKEIQHLLKEYGLIEHCTVNPMLLWSATLSYFADIDRLKKFHGSKHVQTDKIYAYEAFWYLRDHPIQIDNPDKVSAEYVHINEYIFSMWLVNRIATELNSRVAPNIQIDDFIAKLEKHELLINFREKLYYTFRYRYAL